MSLAVTLPKKQKSHRPSSVWVKRWRWRWIRRWVMDRSRELNVLRVDIRVDIIDTSSRKRCHQSICVLNLRCICVIMQPLVPEVHYAQAIIQALVIRNLMPCSLTILQQCRIGRIACVLIPLCSLMASFSKVVSHAFGA